MAQIDLAALQQVMKKKTRKHCLCSACADWIALLPFSRWLFVRAHPTSWTLSFFPMEYQRFRRLTGTRKMRCVCMHLWFAVYTPVADYCLITPPPQPTPPPNVMFAMYSARCLSLCRFPTIKQSYYYLEWANMYSVVRRWRFFTALCICKQWQTRARSLKISERCAVVRRTQH